MNKIYGLITASRHNEEPHNLSAPYARRLCGEGKAVLANKACIGCQYLCCLALNIRTVEIVVG